MFVFFLLLTLLQMSFASLSLPPSTQTLPPWPSPHYYLCPWVMHICSLANLFIIFYPVSLTYLPLEVCQSVPCIHASVSILFISLFCSLDSTYKWEHMLFLFLWLISLNIIISRSIHAVAKGKSPFFFNSYIDPGTAQEQAWSPSLLICA